MRSPNTKQRIFGTIGVMVVLLVIVGYVGYRGARELDIAVEFNYDNYFKTEVWLSELMGRQRQIQQEILTAVLVRTPDAGKAAALRVAENRSRNTELMKLYDATDITKEEFELARAFKESRGKLVQINDRILEAFEQGNFDRAATLVIQESNAANERALLDGDRLLAYQGERAAELKKGSDETFKRNSRFMAAAIPIGVGIAMFLGWTLARSVVSALERAKAVAALIAQGKLGNQIKVDRNDEFGDLLRSLQTMDQKLVEIVGRVREGADHVGLASSQLAQGNDDLSSRTQEQAAALEETASSMEEMTATVKQNADNARHANQLALSACGQADQGGAIVGRAVQAMGEINQASRRIADIIGVIDEIAFQTNLLALNAAVEAARAGEQGRGFAVVATEVRTLAQRSAVAAKEIKELINDSVSKVNAGSDLVDQSGRALQTIVESIKKVTNIVEEISAASQEQASGIDQVNNAVGQMDTTTQQNSALVEEAAAASKEMQMQAENLLQHIQFFQVGAERPQVGHAEAHSPSVQTRHTAPVHQLHPRKVHSAAQSAPQAPAQRIHASADNTAWKEF
jgi:methyl-accepting chemotaxis protein